MGKSKLARLDDIAGYPYVSRYLFVVLQEKGSDMKGQWREHFFENDRPVILKLGCGKREYTVGLGKFFPDKNLTSVDIKGARMWIGAKESPEIGMENVVFLHTSIELISYFFASGEVAETWVIFPDLQMKKADKRLTGIRFMKVYREILSGDGIAYLEVDSNFMYTYTYEMVRTNHYSILFGIDDLYHSNLVDEVSSIRTYYEQQ